MKFVTLLLLFITSCATIDISERTESVLPVCLVVTTLPWTWQVEHIHEAANDWNKRLKSRKFNVYPDCQKHDDLIPMSFVKTLPINCGKRGCTRTLMLVNKRPAFREVLIHEDAPFSTIMHELGHLAGCRHSDTHPPCALTY